VTYKSIKDQIKEWTQFLPISKREYFKHIILILDCTFILFRVSYESFLTIGINLSIYIFDILVYSYWAYDIYHKMKSSEDSLGYIKNRIYYILGLFPFPIFRLFLLISTLKQGIIIYKYIKRGEKDQSLYIDRELNFTFFDFFIDTISDAIFLRSLERVDEVMSRLELVKISKEIITTHKPSIQKVVRDSMSTKTSIGKINSIPIFSGIADQISIDVTNMMIETLENEIMSKIAKELNTYILREMERHVKELDLDRIANKKDQ
jgi:hypothetical protein